MPVLPERALAVRCALVALSCLAVLGLARAALADGDLGLRGIQFWPEQLFGVAAAPAPAPLPSPVEAAAPHRHARRIWAADRTRPLRITLDRERRRTRLAARRRAARLAAARVVRDAAPRFAILPKPERPALVTILQDRTLRDGDAVMTGDGVRLFRGGASWPHQPTDFVRLQFATKLGWSLRHTLTDIDQAPPSRWTMAERPAG